MFQVDSTRRNSFNCKTIKFFYFFTKGFDRNNKTQIDIKS